MMSRFTRNSKYRHVYGQGAKKDYCYENIKVSGSAWDTDLIQASGKYLAINYQSTGGGAFAVLPLLSAYHPPTTKSGKPFGTKVPDIMPLCRGHSGPVLDTSFSPFNDNFLASAAEDGKVLLWQIDDDVFEGWHEEGWGVDKSVRGGKGEVEDIKSCGVLVAGGGRKVGQVVFHPTAENLLASASGDHVIRLWDIKQPEAAKISLKGGSDTIQSMAWNVTGSLLVTTNRDRKLRMFDPRAGVEAVRTVDGHGGIKGSRVVWAGDRDRIITTGFSKMSDRQVALWETGSLGNLKTEAIDSSAGVMMPFFAEGNDVLFLAGKGDGNVRYYEYSDDDLHYLSEYKSSDPQRGMGFLPRRALDVSQNEIARAFKIAGSTIEPLSFVVPRKADSFQSDIYPPAPSLEAPLTAGEYFAGKTAKPKLVDLESGSVTENKTPITAAPLAAAAPAAPSPIDTTSHTREPPSKSQTAPPALASPQVASPAPPTEQQIVEASPTAKELEIEQVDEDEDESSEPAIQHGIVRAEEAANTESADAKELFQLREELAILREQLSHAEAANHKLLGQLEKAKKVGRELLSL